MKLLLIAVLAAVLVAGCVKQGTGPLYVVCPDGSSVLDSIENCPQYETGDCTVLCDEYSVFIDRGYSSPYVRDRQLSEVLKQSYIDMLDNDSIALDTCNGTAVQNLNCHYYGDEIYYNINNKVCYHYDTILIPKLVDDVKDILTEGFLESSETVNNVYYSPRKSSGANWEVEISSYIRIDVEWVCD
jgi:hypothetical protein